MAAAKRRRISIATAEEQEALTGNERSSQGDRFTALRKVAESFTGFRHASEVLTRVRAVPTIFPQFDLATRVGGLPIERFTLLHGPSAGGKSYFTLAMILSFLMKDHPAYFVDAERTTPRSWVEKVFGEYATHPLFMADRPDEYEVVRANVRDFCKHVAAQRKAKKLAEDATGIVVVDSIRKLVPKDLWDLMMKEIKEAAKSKVDVKLDAARSRIHQLKAQMNAVWVDEIVPLLERTGCAMIVIAREIMDPTNTNDRAIKAGTNVKTAGGGALFYDASLDLRAARVGFYGKTTGEGDDKRMDPWGHKYKVDITKTKVSGGGEEFRTSCVFHISNGKKCPEGFDRAMDLLELARARDTVQGTSWLKFGSKKWQGEERALKAMREDPMLFERIERETRATFKLEKTR